MTHNTTRRIALRVLVAYATMITFAVIALGAETIRLGSLTTRVTHSQIAIGRNQAAIQRNEVRITKTNLAQCQRVNRLRIDLNYNAALLRAHILDDAQTRMVLASRLAGRQRRQALTVAAAERHGGNKIVYQPATNCVQAIRLDGSYVPPKPVRFTAQRAHIVLATGP